MPPGLREAVRRPALGRRVGAFGGQTHKGLALLPFLTKDSQRRFAGEQRRIMWITSVNRICVMSCTRFRIHRVRCFMEQEVSWRGDSLRGSSSLRLSG
jgi:hypothetical protein